MSSATAPVTGTPPSLAIGSFGLKFVFLMSTAPVSDRSSRTTWSGELVLSTPWTTRNDCVLGTLTSPMVQDVRASINAAQARR
jgi:hypothetical protein